MTITRLYTRTGVETSPGTKIDADIDNTNSGFNAHESDTTSHGATGANVGTTNTQTLTNKTINSSLTATTGTIINATGDSLTTGTLGDFNSNSADTTARSLVKITNDNAAATGAVNLRIQQDSTGNMVDIYDGATLVGYIDDEGHIITPVLRPGDTLNLGVTYAAGVFTITDAAGAALSATNFGYVGVKSITGGKNISLRVDEATHLFQDDAHAASHLTNLGFGITETAHWAEDMPWFLYVVNEDDTEAGVGFFISRSPCMSVTPAANAIHDYDAAAANDLQTSIFGMWNDDAGKAAKPCTCIGAFRMQWSTTTDDWTVQALGNNDGIGHDKIDVTCAVTYTFPVGQNGCAQADQTYDASGAGTALAFTATNTVTYHLNRDGICDAHRIHSTQSAVGATAAPVRWYVPYQISLASGDVCGSGTGIINNLPAIFVAGNGSIGDAYFMVYHITNGPVGTLSDNQFGHTNDVFACWFRYKAF